MPLEHALIKPKKGFDHASLKRTNHDLVLDHRGERKSVRDWAYDKRCLLTLKELEICVARGRTVSEVLALGRFALKPWAR